MSHKLRDFTVAFSNGTVAAYHGSFEIKDGLLYVWPSIVDKNGTTELIYAHGSWACVDVRDPDVDD